MRPRDVVRKWLDAFNERDIDSLTELYAEDATNHRVAVGPVSGRSAIRAMFEREFTAAEMVCIPVNLLEDGKWAILEWTDPQGMQGCGFFHIVGGKIVLQRGYWDMLSFQRLHNPGGVADL